MWKGKKWDRNQRDWEAVVGMTESEDLERDFHIYGSVVDVDEGQRSWF